MSDIKDLEKSFNEQAYITIKELQKKIDQLTSENASLKIMLEQNIPSLEIAPHHLGISNEQLICETQIHKLQQKSANGELNADETRKFATFVEVLEKIKKNIKDPKAKAAEEMSSEDLLRLVVNNEQGTIKQ